MDLNNYIFTTPYATYLRYLGHFICILHSCTCPEIRPLFAGPTWFLGQDRLRVGDIIK